MKLNDELGKVKTALEYRLKQMQIQAKNYGGLYTSVIILGLGLNT